MEVVFDIEATGLLNQGSIDYRKYPYKLLPTFQVHCIVARDIAAGGMIYKFTPANLWDFPDFLSKCTKVIGHNIIDYDLLVIELFFGIKFDVDPFTLDGREIEVCDTLILSKLLNPDRFGGHGLGPWGERLSEHKDTFGKQTDWKEYSEEMLHYCVQDVNLNLKVYNYLLQQEWRNWDWAEAFWLEQVIRYYVTIQSHFGFFFDKKLAQWCSDDLEVKMAAIELEIEPQLPPKAMTKTTAKQFIPPKIQIKKNGELSSHMINFCERHGLNVSGDEYGDMKLYGLGDRPRDLPLEAKPILNQEPMKLADQDAIKQYLISQGWEPTAWKEKDLTIDTKKQKQTFVKYRTACDRYMEQTMNSEYMSPRLKFLKVKPAEFRAKLYKHDRDKPLRVLSTPSLTVGQDKQICPNLVELGSKYSWVGNLVLWLTYRHRKNSVNSDKGTGWLNNPRIDIDNRIGTPADTAGTNTFRYTHKDVANVPRVSSIYGEFIRALFGVPEGQYQIGSDAAGLEARVEGHFTAQFEGGEEYSTALISEKPNDIHCFSEDTEILTERGWRTFGNLFVEDKVAQWDEGVVSFVTPHEIIWEDYSGPMVSISGRDTDQLLTPNHRVLLMQDRTKNSKVVLASDFKQASSSRIPVAGTYKRSKSCFSKNIAKVLVATQADGHLSKDCAAITYTFTKNRKIARIKELLDACGFTYKESTYKRKGRVETLIRLPAIHGKIIRGYLGGDTKTVPLEKILQLSTEEISEVFNEFFLWDGWVSSNGSNWFIDQTCIHNRDLVVTLGSLLGYKVTTNTYKKKTMYGDCTIYRACVCPKTPAWVGTYSLKKKVVESYEGKIGCVAVPSGFVVVRRNSKIFISGNTVNALKMGVDRDTAKTLKYATTYGAQARKIAKTLGVSLAEAEKIFEDFWEASLPLKTLKERVAKYWKTKGSKVFIKGIDGRKLITRSEHSLLNVLFQSTGAIVMKRQMVLYMRRLKSTGLYSNPFRDSEIKAAQMIHYHK